MLVLNQKYILINIGAGRLVKVIGMGQEHQKNYNKITKKKVDWLLPPEKWRSSWLPCPPIPAPTYGL